MSITLKPFCDKFESLAATADDSFEVAQLSGSSDLLENLPNHAVATITDLPASELDNTGRMIYVEDECKYYYSNGSSWTSCFNPPLVLPGALVYGWGSNAAAFDEAGALGVGDDQPRSAPTLVVGGICNWSNIVATAGVTFGLTDSGNIYGWGYNANSNLGTGASLNDQSSPVSIVGGFTDWCYVNVGGFSCVGKLTVGMGIRTNGTLWTWGFNDGGQLGIDSAGYPGCCNYPTQVCGGFTDWIAAASSGDHTLGLRANGELYTWGSNYNGKLGINTDAYGTSKSSPVLVCGGFTDWTHIAAAGFSGGSHSVSAAIRNGCLYTWGSNGFGVLGINTGVGGACICSAYDQSSPVLVCGGFTDWCAISIGQATPSMAAIRTNGTLWSWGTNTGGAPFAGFGILGDGTQYDRSSPVSVVGGFTDWCAIAINQYNTVGLRTNGTLWVWGLQFTPYGMFLGATPPNTYGSYSPISVTTPFSDWCDVAAGGFGNLFATRAI